MKELDFENDLKMELLEYSKDLGVKISANQDLDKIILDYFTVRSKLIMPKHRKIFINPQFEKEIMKHPKHTEILAIINHAKRGGNLNQFQSKRLLESNFHDHLLNEWNIYHFHLSLLRDKKSKFVKQVNSMLFAFVDDNQIIFLGTDTHKDGIFGDTKWIEVLHENYQSVIAEYKLKDVTDISPDVDAIGRQTLWNKGYTLGMTKIKDTVYRNPGLGRASSGHSMKVSMFVVDILRWIYKLREQVTNSRQEICDYLNVSLDKSHFKVRIGKKNFELYEKHSQGYIVEFPQILMEKDEIVKQVNIMRK